MRNKMIDKYIKSVGSLLQCPAGEKKAFLARLRDELGSAELPEDASFDDICERFGAPEALAAGMTADGADPRYLKKKTSVARIVAIAAAALLAIAVICVVFELIDNHRQANGYGKEYGVEYVTAVLTEEDAP